MSTKAIAAFAMWSLGIAIGVCFGGASTADTLPGVFLAFVGVGLCLLYLAWGLDFERDFG